MPRIALFCTLLLCWALAQPARAQSDYKYYQVRSGDTVESIAAAHGLDLFTVLECNSKQILEGKGLLPGMILVLPSPEAGKSSQASSSGPPPAVATEARSGLVPPESASPSAPTPRTSVRPASSAGGGLVRNSQGVLAVRGTPSFRNRMVGSDGRTVEIPTYVPPVVEEPEEEDSPPGRSSLASRRGRPIRALLTSARRYLGVPYVWGGEDPSGFDCSGYVQYLYGLHGVQLPRTADVQFMAGRSVPRGQEQPGDLVFFETYAPGASHVGVYLGRGAFIHASSVGFVRISSLEEDYFSARYLGARRFF
jgi:cell wall-associated NlpC family hydrolase